MLDGLDEFCTEALAEHGCASVSVAVATRDELVRTRAYGLADVADRRPATPETVYGLASITKAFTAVAVCLAAEDGLLDLDTPIPGTYGWTGPTPRQLLHHRGGFPAFYNFHYGSGPLPIDMDRYRTLVREPGTGFEYSNLGYQQLGELVEAATGQDLGRFLQERIAEPLGLTSFGYGSAYPGTAPVAQALLRGRSGVPHLPQWPPRGRSRLGDRRRRGALRPDRAPAARARHGLHMFDGRRSTTSSATASAGSSRPGPDR